MKVRSLFVLTALAGAACSGFETETPPPVCLLDCSSSVITFTLTNALPGTEIAIAVGEPDGTVHELSCQRGTDSVVCLPVSARVVATFDTDGALQSVAINSPTSGTYAVQIAVDGMPAAAGSFMYEAPARPFSCGDPCGGHSDPACYACPPSQTFTIAI